MPEQWFCLSPITLICTKTKQIIWHSVTRIFNNKVTSLSVHLSIYGRNNSSENNPRRLKIGHQLYNDCGSPRAKSERNKNILNQVRHSPIHTLCYFQWKLRVYVFLAIITHQKIMLPVWKLASNPRMIMEISVPKLKWIRTPWTQFIPWLATANLLYLQYLLYLQWLATANHVSTMIICPVCHRWWHTLIQTFLTGFSQDEMGEGPLPC